MANTSPSHMPMRGNVHPIKMYIFDIFRDVIFLLIQVFIFLIDRATQEVPMKVIERNCRSSFWDIRHWIVCMQKFVMIHWILQ